MSSLIQKCPTFQVTQAVTGDQKRGIRCIPDANGVLAPAAAGELGGGTLPRDVVTANQTNSALELMSLGGVRYMVANGGIAAYAEFSFADDGKIGPAGATPHGRVLQAATADNDLIAVETY